MRTVSISEDESSRRYVFTIFAKLFLLGNVVPYAAFTIGFFAIPIQLASYIGITLHSTSAIADFRAMYGGLCLAIGVILVLGVFRNSWTDKSILLAILAAAGLLFGRLITLALDGPWNMYICVSALMEIVSILGGIAIVLWEKKLNQSRLVQDK
jgi:hypothetical protein